MEGKYQRNKNPVKVGDILNFDILGNKRIGFSLAIAAYRHHRFTFGESDLGTETSVEAVILELTESKDYEQNAITNAKKWCLEALNLDKKKAPVFIQPPIINENVVADNQNNWW